MITRNNNNLRQALAALPVACCLILAEGALSSGYAQVIDSWYLDPAANGTNVIDTYVTYQHFGGFQYSNGQNFPGTTLDQYSATVRYAHYFYIADHPAGLQLFQTAGYFSNWQFNGFNNDNAPGMHKLQAGDTTLSAFFWPYASHVNQTYLYTAAYVTPPAAGYSENYHVTAGYGGWQGDVQIGLTQGFGPNFSVEAAADVNLQGSEPLGGGYERNVLPIYRLQVWTN
jgi:hypothetical protein